MKEEALKLADELENGHTASQELRNETANILRQQLDRIAELEKQSEALADEYAIQVNEVCKLSYEIQNLKAGLLSHNDIYYEPTAWINHIKQTGGDFYELNVSGRGEPLYRHPPQTKPLSDEEIYEIWERFNGEIKNFARAIEKRHGIK